MNSTNGRGPRRGTVTAAVVGALALAAIVFAAGIGIGHGSGAAAPTGSSTAGTTGAAGPSAGPVAAGQASICGLPGLDGSGASLAAAPPTTWTTVGTMAAPSSRSVGPGKTGGDGLRSCYAHTVAGAVFAVANIWAMGTDFRLTKPLLERQTAAGPGRTTALAAKVPQSNTGLSAQIAGFKVTSYTGSAATVDIAFHLNTGQLISFPAPVKWESGDWKYQLADDGTPVFRPSSLVSLSGYTPWAGAA